ncbi:MAG: recombinase RecT [Armatimonadetes bacterium]|nr:recombinase RecT [Armatimonadota bacterium]
MSDTTALALVEGAETEATGGSALPQVSDAQLPVAGFTSTQVDVLRRTVCKDATEDEFFMFAGLCERYQLDPFNKEIWFIKFGGQPTIFTSRDGYLKICQRDANFRGIQSAAVREGDEFELDPVNNVIRHRFGAKRGKVLGAWAVAKHAIRDPVVCFADFLEYDKSGDKGGETWKKYPSAMICKVAENMALKRQGGISGLTTWEEIGPPEYLEAQRGEDGTFRTQPAQARTQAGGARGAARTSNAPSGGEASGGVDAELEAAKQQFRKLALESGLAAKADRNAFLQSQGLTAPPRSLEEYRAANAALEGRIEELRAPEEPADAEDGDFVPDEETPEAEGGDPLAEGEDPRAEAVRDEWLQKVEELESRIEGDPKRRAEMSAGWRKLAKVPKDLDRQSDEQLQTYAAWLEQYLKS